MSIARGCLTLLMFLTSARALASETTFFNVNLGYPSMTVELDPRIQPSLGSQFAIGIGMWRTLRDLPFGIGVATTVYNGGNFGPLPLIQSGFTLAYFPWNRPVSNYSINDEVVVNSTSWCPFLKLTPGVDFMNFRNPTYTNAFGSSSPMVNLAIGILFPGDGGGHWSAELAYSTSFNATDANSSPISVTGYLLSVAYEFGLP